MSYVWNKRWPDTTPIRAVRTSCRVSARTASSPSAGLPALLGVSAETIRRDLRVLESRGLIRRAYGVAYPVESSAFESALEMRSNINPEEKVRVANAVIQRLGDAKTIFIDEGYQTQLVRASGCRLTSP